MFTGIVEELGTVAGGGTRLEVRCSTVVQDSEVGASVAVSGVCLTVVDRRPPQEGRPGSLSFDLSPETLGRSTLGDLGPGDGVNLERPVTLLQRLGGHLVQGHVDGVGEIGAVVDVETGREVEIGLPADLARYVVEKGSIAVDGVSLTVTAVGEETFAVALIPHTLSATTLGGRRRGDRVNLEVDIMAKHVERLMGRAG